jgi:protein O-mannosyl-transferase
VLQFIPFGEVLYADRYAYIPLIGFAWTVGLLLEKVPIYFKNTIRLSTLFLILLSFFRCQVWSSGVNLYTDILRNHPNSFVALTSIGAEYMFQNDDKKALDYFLKSIKASPENYKGHYNLGLLMIKKNRPEDAMTSFNKSISIFDYPKAYIGRATAYYMLGNLPKAIEDANHVLSTDKNNAKAHFVLGNCYSEMNQLEKAMNEYTICLDLNNEEADYYFKKAIVYGKKQDFVASLTTLEICLKLKPDMYEAYFWRGVAKINLKQNPCEDFKIAARNNYEPAIKAYNNYCNH